MNARKKEKIIFIVKKALPLLLAVVVLFSFYCSLDLFEHDCIGDDCPVCAFLSVCRASFRSPGLSAIASVVSLIVFFFKKTDPGTIKTAFSPVCLGVRLND